MARYRKVEVATWYDDRFRALSPARPCGQHLWLYLLSGPRTTSFPGLLVGREEVMAGDLQWPIGPFREAFAEASRKGLVKADWKAGLVVLRKALLDSTGEPRDTARPESPNVIKSWAKGWDEIPDCQLKAEYLRSLESFAKALGETYQVAFREGFRRALLRASTHPSLNQDQDQDQEQEQKQEQEILGAVAPGPDLAHLLLKVEAKRGKPPKEPSSDHAKAKAHWFAYWARRNAGQKPTWNGKQAKLLNDVLTHGLAEVTRRIDLLEASADAWHRTWDFALFASNSDRLLGSTKSASVGRIEPKTAEAYADGDVSL